MDLHRRWAARRAWRVRAALAALLAALAWALKPALGPWALALPLAALLYPSRRELAAALAAIDRRLGLAYRTALETPVTDPAFPRLRAEAERLARRATPPPWPWREALLAAAVWALAAALPPAPHPAAPAPEAVTGGGSGAGSPREPGDAGEPSPQASPDRRARAPVATEKPPAEAAGAAKRAGEEEPPPPARDTGGDENRPPGDAAGAEAAAANQGENAPGDAEAPGEQAEPAVAAGDGRTESARDEGGAAGAPGAAPRKGTAARGAEDADGERAPLPGAAEEVSGVRAAGGGEGPPAEGRVGATDAPAGGAVAPGMRKAETGAYEAAVEAAGTERTDAPADAPPAELPSPWAAGRSPEEVRRAAERYLQTAPLAPEVAEAVRRYFELER